MLKQQLQQKLQQKLSPQQIQLIRLLELPAIELEERVKHELEDNPALEEEKSLLMILNVLIQRKRGTRFLLLILRPTFLWEII